MTFAIKIRPLSINQAWQGRRFKTKAYKAYEQQLMMQLPNVVIPDGQLHLSIVAGYSNRAADIDNCLKPFIDVLQKRYDFDDKRIYRLTVDKQITRKGAEFIGFDFRAMGKAA